MAIRSDICNDHGVMADVQVNKAQEKIQEGTEGAKNVVQEAADAVGDAVKKVTGQD